MVERIVFDAMITRADFNQRDLDTVQSASARPAASITFENLQAQSSFVLQLRKPDFQRETNQWSVQQAVTFIQSFLDGDLVPSVILWQSNEGFIFVIDGAHRLSALRAWIEDDYGDGPTSIAFFNGEIPEGQKKTAKKMRSAIERQVGSYKSLKDKLAARSQKNDIEYDAKTNKRLKHLGSRALELQWVTGDADVAEASFFKINTQGTPLDTTEESLLRNRNKAPAIAARSIVRAATGHKYWSKFEEPVKVEIERLAAKANELLFQPELKSPIKAFPLPLGGSASNLDALALLMKLLTITEGTQTDRRAKLEDAEEDIDGRNTITSLNSCISVLSRISGNSPASLGLHPAVYIYSDRAKHLPDFFLGIVYLIRGKIINNDSGFFSNFTKKRAAIESFIRSNKALLSQVLLQISSRSRTERIADMIDYMVRTAPEGLTIEGIAHAVRLKGSIVDLRQKVEGKNFTDESKSAILIRTALASAIKCPICSGLMDPALSVSYDHIVRKQDGGTGSEENIQICHPYCNTGVKN